MNEVDDLRERLRQVVRARGVDRVADDVPCDRSTIFRMLRGDTVRPARAVAEGIQRVVDDEELRSSAN